MNIKIVFHRFMMRRAFKIWRCYTLWRNRDLFRTISTYRGVDDIDLMNSFMSEDHRRGSDTPLTLFQRPENSKDASEKAHWNGGFYNLEQNENTETSSLPINLSDHEQQF
jgi:hypothetical protein